MKKCLISLFAASLLMIASSAFAQRGTYDECSNGCLPGVNACSNCCLNTFNPLFSQCRGNWNDCLSKCGWDRKSCNEKCQTEYIRCNNMATSVTELDFKCPNWQPAKKCPYECQVWNPASRTCVGARMNGCQ